jgi:cytochrome c-type biogenesis protein CcmH
MLFAAACQQKTPAPAAKVEATPAAALPAGHPPIAASARPSGAGFSLSGTVSASASVASKLGGKGALFLIARGATSQQIVAVRKEENVGLPFAFTLTEADSMIQGTALEATLDLTARVSKSGDAMPAAGDVEGVTKGVRAGARDVVITLDRVRP